MRYAPKGGRPSSAPGRVPEVESLPCSSLTANGGNHRLANVEEFRELVTRCEHCRRTWAELGTEMRAAIGWSNGSES